MLYYMFFFSLAGMAFTKAFFFWVISVFGGWCMLIGVDQVKDRRN